MCKWQLYVQGTGYATSPPRHTRARAHAHTHTHKWNNREMRRLEFDLRPVRAGLVVGKAAQEWDSFRRLHFLPVIIT